MPGPLRTSTHERELPGHQPRELGRPCRHPRALAGLRPRAALSGPDELSHVVGLDLSGESLAAARRLAADAGTDIPFVEADVYSAPTALADHAPFDLVYTGIGAIGWLPSIDRWAATVAALLRPGGRLFIREGHPVVWALDDPRPDGLVVLAYPYFETEAGTAWDEPSTYAQPAEGDTTQITATRTHEWNHGLGEIITALLHHGLEITGLVEHRTLPYRPLGEQMIPDPQIPGEYRLAVGDDRVPMSYTLQAILRG